MVVVVMVTVVAVMVVVVSMMMAVVVVVVAALVTRSVNSVASSSGSKVEVGVEEGSTVRVSSWWASVSLEGRWAAVSVW